MAEPDDSKMFEQFAKELFSLEYLCKDGGSNEESPKKNMTFSKEEEIGLDDLS